MVDGENDDEELTEEEMAEVVDSIFDTSKTKIEEWPSKDRKVYTIRISDPSGLCEMKVYKKLTERNHKFELLINIADPHDEKH